MRPFSSSLAAAASTLLLLGRAAAEESSLLAGSSPIWHPVINSTYNFFRSPDFALSGSGPYTVTFTAQASPNVDGSGTTQSKLLGAFKLTVNGVLVTAGPGHSVPQTMQAVQTTPDLSALLRPAPALNTLTVAAYFQNTWGGKTDASSPPRIQAVLADATGAVILGTSAAWMAYSESITREVVADGDSPAAAHWYHVGNEDLSAPLRPLNFDLPGFAPTGEWVAAVVQPAWAPEVLYAEPAAPPAALWRTACSVAAIPSPSGGGGASLCGKVAESAPLVLSCGADGVSGGSTISDILFASYGTPYGACSPSPPAPAGANTFAVDRTCDSSNSTKVLRDLCVGKASCTVTPTNAVFGADPCHLTPKFLAAAIACSSPPAPPPPANSTYSYLIDYGMQFMGGVNLTFAFPDPSDAPAPGASPFVVVKLGEELSNVTGLPLVPTRAAVNYTSRWTLAFPGSRADGDWQAANAGLHAHEFIQFRYAIVEDSPIPLASVGGARAWVVQHPFLGTGENPFEIECALSTPNLQTAPPASSFTPAAASSSASSSSSAAASAAFAAAAASSAEYGMFSSSLPGLDAVFNLTAYTAVATSLDVNVDSQTRQRDICHIDALITGAEQYAIFPPGDYAVQRRTFRDAFGNDSAIWGSWTEFKQSGALMPYLDALETGDTSIGRDVWSDDDGSITADSSPLYNSLQFYAGVRYFNLSGRGLLSYPVGCGGSWACDALVDWPTNTRDGYDMTASNTDDAVRNGLGALALDGASAVAGWLGKTDAAARYASMAAAVRAGFLTYMLRTDPATGHAFFADGAVSEHAAVHSTVYGAAAGAADGNATLSEALAQYLIARNVVPSSCMTGRWYVEALYRLGLESSSAADFALELLSRTAYPSWGFMLTLNATTTLEAWAPWDKWNTDWAHPWCASPAFLIPRSLMGVRPLEKGWARMQAAPQPSSLASATVRVPTPLGSVLATFAQGPGPAGGNVQLQLTVPSGSTAQVCLPALHASFSAAGAGVGGRGGGGSVLIVDGSPVPSVASGRLLCTVTDVGAGAHTVVRQ